MKKLIYKRLVSKNDADISLLTEIYKSPEISRYLSIGDNYFDYVTNTENVYYYKIYDGVMIGSLHIEQYSDVLSMALLIFPKFQKSGYGTQIVKDIQEDIFNLKYDKISVSVDKKNVASLSLFKRSGFTATAEEQELIHLTYVMMDP